VKVVLTIWGVFALRRVNPNLKVKKRHFGLAPKRKRVKVALVMGRVRVRERKRRRRCRNRANPSDMQDYCISYIGYGCSSFVFVCMLRVVALVIFYFSPAATDGGEAARRIHYCIHIGYGCLSFSGFCGSESCCRCHFCFAFSPAATNQERSVRAQLARTALRVVLYV